MPEKQTNQSTSGQKTHVPPKKKYRWLKRHEKMHNTTHHERNANQNHNEAPSHTSQNGCYPKSTNINAGEGAKKKEPSYTVGGNVK